MASFFVVKLFRISISSCVLCSLEDTQSEQIKMLQCSQWNSHTLVACFEHLVVDPRSPKGTTLCSMHRSERLTPTQGIQSLM